MQHFVLGISCVVRPTASYGESNCRRRLGLPLPGLALPDDITVCIDY
jgi:hypothetical protein